MKLLYFLLSNGRNFTEILELKKTEFFLRAEKALKNYIKVTIADG
jgi:hypothetical protein